MLLASSGRQSASRAENAPFCRFLLAIRPAILPNGPLHSGVVSAGHPAKVLFFGKSPFGANMRRRSTWEDQGWRGRRRRREGTRLLNESVGQNDGRGVERSTVHSAQGIRLMSQAPKDSRTPAEKARDTASIIGSFKHEGYVPNPEDEAIHQRAERREITTEEAIAIFRERALERERKALARKRQQPA